MTKRFDIELSLATTEWLLKEARRSDVTDNRTDDSCRRSICMANAIGLLRCTIKEVLNKHPNNPSFLESKNFLRSYPVPSIYQLSGIVTATQDALNQIEITQGQKKETRDEENMSSSPEPTPEPDDANGLTSEPPQDNEPATNDDSITDIGDAIGEALSNASTAVHHGVQRTDFSDVDEETLWDLLDEEEREKETLAEQQLLDYMELTMLLAERELDQALTLEEIGIVGSYIEGAFRAGASSTKTANTIRGWIEVRRSKATNKPDVQEEGRLLAHV